MSEDFIPLHRPYLSGQEMRYLQKVMETKVVAGGGPFGKRCEQWMRDNCAVPWALLMHTCTAALETVALVTEVGPGDEVIMPSFTFVSTANAFVLRGAKPVFVDIREDTLDLDESLLEDAITERTKLIVAVHYAGVSCEMDEINAVAGRYGLRVVEDAAQGVGATYRGKPLGSLGDLGAFSFHETKNVIAGEGGALLLFDDTLARRAEVIRDKGTNREAFLRGEVDKYTWRDIGSSLRVSELGAAVLLAQLEAADAITERRLAIWNRYQTAFDELENDGRVRRPVVPDYCEHNGHIYYLLFLDFEDRERARKYLRRRHIGATFHFLPLHDSPAGQAHARVHGKLSQTVRASERLLRLPLYPDMTDVDQSRVIEAIFEYCAGGKD